MREAPENNLHIYSAEPEQLARLARTPEYFLPLSFVDAALAAGHRCLLATENERLLGYLWSSEGETEIDDVFSVRVPANSSYIYKCFVCPEARGKRILSRLLGHHAATDLNHSAFYSLILNYNLASRRAFSHAGMSQIGQARLKAGAQPVVKMNQAFLNSGVVINRMGNEKTA